MVATLTATSVTIGSPRPRELARFYAELLGWPLTGELERHFQRPVWPAEAGRPLASQHLDILVTGDLDEAVSWAVGHGAVLGAVQPQEDVRVLFDPDGHPFCLFV